MNNVKFSLDLRRTTLEAAAAAASPREEVEEIPDDDPEKEPYRKRMEAVWRVCQRVLQGKYALEAKGFFKAILLSDNYLPFIGGLIPHLEEGRRLASFLASSKRCREIEEELEGSPSPERFMALSKEYSALRPQCDPHQLPRLGEILIPHAMTDYDLVAYYGGEKEGAGGNRSAKSIVACQVNLLFTDFVRGLPPLDKLLEINSLSGLEIEFLQVHLSNTLFSIQDEISTVQSMARKIVDMVEVGAANRTITIDVKTLPKTPGHQRRASMGALSARGKKFAQLEPVNLARTSVDDIEAALLFAQVFVPCFERVLAYCDTVYAIFQRVKPHLPLTDILLSSQDVLSPVETITSALQQLSKGRHISAEGLRREAEVQLQKLEHLAQAIGKGKKRLTLKPKGENTPRRREVTSAMITQHLPSIREALEQVSADEASQQALTKALKPLEGLGERITQEEIEPHLVQIRKQFFMMKQDLVEAFQGSS